MRLALPLLLGASLRSTAAAAAAGPFFAIVPPWLSPTIIFIFLYTVALSVRVCVRKEGGYAILPSLCCAASLDDGCARV